MSSFKHCNPLGGIVIVIDDEYIGSGINMVATTFVMFITDTDIIGNSLVD